MPRKTDSSSPADWLFLAESNLAGLKALAEKELAYEMCRSELAAVLEKVLTAELIRMGWLLEKAQGLERLAGELRVRRSDLMPQVDPLCEALAEACFTDRYPGFDLEDPDWPKLRNQIRRVADLAGAIKTRVEGRANQG